MNTIPPNEEEILNAVWLESLFPFDVNITLYIYDYSKNGRGRHCSITVDEMHEDLPYVYSSSDFYGCGPNTIVLKQFALQVLPKGPEQWYASGKGFSIPNHRIEALKNNEKVQEFIKRIKLNEEDYNKQKSFLLLPNTGEI